MAVQASVAWPLGLLGITLLLVAAKAHGRQIRLERELAGYTHVTFGGENPPWVQELWRRDRIRFWSAYPAAALLLGFALTPHGDWRLLLLVVVSWAPATAFTYAGLSSTRRFIRRTAAGEQDGNRRAWIRSVNRRSLGYWGLVLLLGAASGALLAAGT